MKILYSDIHPGECFQYNSLLTIKHSCPPLQLVFLPLFKKNNSWYFPFYLINKYWQQQNFATTWAIQKNIFIFRFYKIQRWRLFPISILVKEKEEEKNIIKTMSPFMAGNWSNPPPPPPPQQGCKTSHLERLRCLRWNILKDCALNIGAFSSS